MRRITLLPAALLAAGSLVAPFAGSAAARVAPRPPVPPAQVGPSAAQLSAAHPGSSARELAHGAVSSAPKPVVLQGHGYGNGVGMGQWGAYGYATGQDKTWQWIVGHYYAPTYLEPIAPAVDRADIGVHLVELDGASLTEVAAARPGATLRMNGDRRGRTDGVTHTGVRKVVTATAGDVRVDLPGVGWRDYQGSVVVQPDGQTWNEVPLEDYVAGVVPEESPASWAATRNGEAALQAQAVAARSYALAYVAWLGDVCDSDACQVYGGDPADEGLGTYESDVLDAASSTAGMVMCSKAESPCAPADVVTTQFGASTGGWTVASAPFSAEVDEGDAVASNPYHTWTSGSCPTAFAPAAVAATAGLATLTKVGVSRRTGGAAAWGGHALSVTVVGRTRSGQARSVTVPAWTFAADLGLCSTWFRFAST